VKGDATFVDSTVAGATILQGSRVGFSMNGPEDIGYMADATVAHLDLQRAGREFNVAALATDRNKTDLNAHITAEGHGTKPAEMNLTASGTMTDSTVMGGHIPQVAFNGTLAADTARVPVNGALADFDPGALSGKPALKGKTGGTVDLDATLAQVSKG